MFLSGRVNVGRTLKAWGIVLAQGPTEQAVKSGKAEVKRILEETTERVMRRDQGAAGAVGRYSVM